MNLGLTDYHLTRLFVTFHLTNDYAKHVIRSLEPQDLPASYGALAWYLLGKHMSTKWVDFVCESNAINQRGRTGKEKCRG